MLGQVYYGAASTRFKGVQSMIREKYPTVI
jgi:hypothetical protein